jgi:hypothetical protein
MPSPSQLGALTQYLTRSIGPAARARIFAPSEVDELSRTLSPLSHQHPLINSILESSGKPDIRTHVLYDLRSKPVASFQLLPINEELGFDTPNYLSYLQSFMRGGGTQALQEARRFSPLSLVSTLESRPFYEKMLTRLPDFLPHPDPDLRGIAYQYKAHGGSV